jgi:hypothetical protein
VSEKHGVIVDADGARVGLMDPDAIDERQLSSVAQALLKSISELASDPDKRVYAVMDGSQFNDLPRLLKLADVSHRPLYRYAGGDYAVIVGGPWLVNPYQAALSHSNDTSSNDSAEGDVSEEELESRSASLSAQMVSSLEAGDPTGGGMLPGHAVDPALVIKRLQKIIELSDGKPTLVFWSGDGDFAVEDFYRHLRGMNTVRVPKSDKGDKNTQMLSAGDGREIAVVGQEDDSAEYSSFRGCERVIFRHADANVMMQVIPVLDETQTAILFGPAEQIIFAPDSIWGGGLKRARKRNDVPPQHGILSLTEDNIATMADIRLEASRRKRAALFRNSVPHLLDGLNDEEALVCMERYEQQARTHGLRTERGFYQWTYLMSASEGRFIQSPDIRDHLKGGNPDKRLDEMMGFMANVAVKGVAT